MVTKLNRIQIIASLILRIHQSPFILKIVKLNCLLTMKSNKQSKQREFASNYNFGKLNTTRKVTFLFVITIIQGITTNSLFSQYTWGEHISPILYNNCVNCHNDGGIAPFSLIGYTKAKAYAQSIKASVVNRSMPPWPASPTYNRYAHEKILSALEIQQISNWVDAGAPEGDASKAPIPPNPKKGITIQNPTLIGKIPTYLVNTSTDVYRCFVIPTQFNTNQYLTEIEVIPGNPKIVHHVLVFHDTSSKPKKLDDADSEPGYLSFGGTGSNSSNLIGVYVPGQEPYQFPKGFACNLPPNGYIIMQIHYPGGVNAEIDSTKVILKTNSNALRPIYIVSAINHQPASLTNGPLYLAPDERKTFYSRTENKNYNLIALAVAPHMHLIGKSIKSYLVNGKDTTKIIDIPEWDFHWQRTYSFRKPVIIPKGSTLWGEAYYDNTSSNPNNPNFPSKAISLGEGTGDEMMLVYYWMSPYNPGDENMVLDTTSLKSILSITRNPLSTQWKIYPNPIQTNSASPMNIESETPIVGIELVDLAGKTIIGNNQKNLSSEHQTFTLFPSVSMAGNKFSTQLSLLNLAPGTYQIKLIGAQGQSVNSTLLLLP